VTRRELPEVTQERLDNFLDFVREHPGCTNREAADAAGLVRRQVRERMAEDEDFASDYHEARGYDVEKLRARLIQRVFDDEKPYDRGLLEALRVWDPAFADIRRLELTGAGGGPVRVEHTGTDVATLRAILEEGGEFDVEGEAVEDAELIGPVGGPVHSPALPSPSSHEEGRGEEPTESRGQGAPR
jgi:hypothetical protein